jgi:hypothetical protein
LPGNTPAEAREAFHAPLRRCLDCITTDQLYARPRRPGDTELLTLTRHPLPLRSAQLGRVQLALSHWYRLTRDGPWHATTTGYEYRLIFGEHQELAAWHWHPAPLPGPDFPHLHITNEPLTRRAHLPTGRVSIESVLRLLIDDLGVPARRADYAEVFGAAERDFIEYRRWHA